MHRNLSPASPLHTAARALLVAAFIMAVPSLAEAAPCPDADGDGWGVAVSGCDATGLAGLGDCNDGNAAVNPGAAEVCGDDIDNDCDGDVDFGLKDIDFFENPDTHVLEPVEGLCFISSPPGCHMSMTCMQGMSCCMTAGHKECTVALDAVECISDTPGGSFQTPQPEGPQGGGTCYDFIDNDCDGCFDTADADCTLPNELCNNFDDDNDGLTDEDLGLGTSCTVGIGSCMRTGQIVCASNGTVKCSESPQAPGVEGPAGSGTCADGIDNDCDALADLNDPQCLSAEICDGIDNDNDGQTDESVSDLGDACSFGQGACAVAGVKTCSADGTTTVCSPTQQLGNVSPEGPSGLTCGDAIDNDCDGLTDGADPGCGSAGIAIGCALPHLQNAPNGASCEGFHRIEYQVSGADPGAQVTAELLALDTDGTILAVLPVNYGETAHLTSRLDPADWKWVSRRNLLKGGPLAAPGDWHEVFAPVPLLRVRVKDSLNEATAWCTNVPWLDVVRPDGDVSDGSNGASQTDVLAALPLSAVDTLNVTINGVDIFADLGIDPATDFPGTHPGGMVTIGSTSVTISDIRVDIAPSIDTLSSNSVSMKLEGLGCGGNEVIVDADPAWPIGTNLPVASACNVDDMHDCGSSSVFEVRIDNPTQGLITAAVPTPVQGEICHGLPVASASINGLALNLAGAIFTPGGGECSGGTYQVPINVQIPQTNLHAEAVGMNATLGTFDPGQNRLIAGATDEEGHRVYKTLGFAVGGPGSLGSASAAVKRGFGELERQDWQLGSKVFAEGVTAAMATTLNDSFVLNIEESALDAFFSSTCEQATACLEAQVRGQFESCLSKNSSGGCQDFVKFTPDISGSCDPDTTVRVNPGTFQFLEPVACDVSLADGPGPNGTGGTVNLLLTVPQLKFEVHAGGSCHGFAWAANTTIDADVEVTLPKDGEARSTVSFAISELNFEDPTSPLQDGVALLGSGIVSTVVTDAGDSGVSGWGVFILNLLAEIFTLGFADIDWSVPTGTVIEDADLFMGIDPGSRQIAIEIPNVKPDPDPYEAAERKLTTTFQDAQISSMGLKAITSIAVDATHPDPAIGTSLGFLKTPAPTPMPPISNGNTSISIADDVLNGIFAAAAVSGEISSATCGGTLVQGTCCSDATLQTMDDLLPADCTDPNFINTGSAPLDAVFQGACLGIKAADLAPAAASALCESYIVPGGAFATVVGQATCHGARGASCSTIPVAAIGGGVEIALCDKAADLNVKASDPILLCARSEIAPAFLIADNATSAGKVESVLRLNDLLVSILVDRAGDGFDGGELPSFPSCPNDGTNADCAFIGVCLDMTFDAEMTLVNGVMGPELAFNLLNPRPQPRPAGEACEGGISITFNSDETATMGAAASNPIQDNLTENIGNSVPVQAPQNISLGGVVSFQNATLFSEKTSADFGRCENDPTILCMTNAQCGGNRCVQFQDYLGIKGEIVAEPAPAPDQDGDGLECDNCPEIANPGQEDADMDGRGDLCDPCPNDATNACLGNSPIRLRPFATCRTTARAGAVAPAGSEESCDEARKVTPRGDRRSVPQR
jgi:hypothetical protein